MQKIVWRNTLPVGPIALRSARDVIEIGAAPPPPPSALVEIMRGPQGPEGPQGPVYEPDLPDFTLIFDNQLV